MPDGFFDLLINASESKSSAILTGVWDRMAAVEYGGDALSFGVRFKPIALDIIRAASINGLVNTAADIELKDLGLNKNRILDYIHAGMIDRLIEYLDNSLIKLFGEKAPNDKNMAVFKLIEKNKGIIPIRKIEELTGISARQIHRIVSAKLGISAKEYINIVRFHEILGNTLIDPADIWGYYDQSHFIREFKKFTGKTPQSLDLKGDVRFIQYCEKFNR
jgi:AraC-like DNA-binding protein